MAIVKMSKFTLLSFESHKAKVLELLQNFSGVEFINLQDESLLEKDTEFNGLNKDIVGEAYHENEEKLSKLKFSLEFMEKYSPIKKGITDMFQNKKELSFDQLESAENKVNWKEVYEDLKDKDRMLGELQNEQSKIETEIEIINKWIGLDIKLEDLSKTKYTKAFLGTVSNQYKDTFEQELKTNINTGWFEIISSDTSEIYILLFVHSSEEEKAKEILKNLGFSAFSGSYKGTPRSIIDGFKKHLEHIRKQVADIKDSIIEISSKREELTLVYEYYNNLITREAAVTNFLKSDSVTAISGWVAEKNKEKLSSVIEKKLGAEFYIEYSAPQDEDDVPVMLKNNVFNSSFEGVLEMYSLPQYKEVDPTPIFSIFYFIFFGMMLSDAGYGLLMALGSAFMIYKVKDEEKRKNYKLFFFSGISTIIWGAIYGGWFGDLLPKYFGIKVPFLMDPTTNVITLMVISVSFGVVHIFLGLGIKAYMLIRDGQLKDAIYDVFTWYATLVGVILLAVGFSFGKWLFIIGIIGLLFTQGRTAPSLGGKIGGGIYGVYGITAYFGDVVSYLRLLALGLTTGFIANAMNLILSLLAGNIVVRIVLVPILFVLFHVFNLALNAVGTYVHTARLQYLEFFNKFYEGGGKKFKPFEYCDEYIKIQKEN
jgi:V/A-type H+-transporting ATPase subunit I